MAKKKRRRKKKLQHLIEEIIVGAIAGTLGGISTIIIQKFLGI